MELHACLDYLLEVAKVDELMALCDQLEQQLSQADQQSRRLLEAVRRTRSYQIACNAIDLGQ